MSRRKSWKKAVACAVSVMMLAGGTVGIMQAYAEDKSQAAESFIEEPEDDLAALVRESEDTAPEDSVETVVEPEAEPAGDADVDFYEEPSEEEPEVYEEPSEEEWSEEEDTSDDGSEEEEPGDDGTGEEEPSDEGSDEGEPAGDDGSEEEPSDEPEDSGDPQEGGDDVISDEPAVISEPDEPGTEDPSSGDSGDDIGTGEDEPVDGGDDIGDEPGTGDVVEPGTDSTSSEPDNPDELPDEPVDVGSEEEEITGADSGVDEIDDVISIAESVPEEIVGAGETKDIELNYGVATGNTRSQLISNLKMLEEYGIVVSKLQALTDQYSNYAFATYDEGSTEGCVSSPVLAGAREIPYILRDVKKGLTIGDDLPGTASIKLKRSQDELVSVENASSRTDARKIYQSSDDLREEIVALLQAVIDSSSAIKSVSATKKITAASTDGKNYVIDTQGEEFAADAFIVIKADAMIPYLAGGHLTIKKQPGQTIAFNTSKDGIKIGKYTVVSGDTTVESTASTNQKQNDLLRQAIISKIIWNVREASDVTLVNTAGTFLVPKNSAQVLVAGDSSGTVAVNGTLVAKAAWHYLNRNRTSTATLAVKKVSSDESVTIPIETFTFSLSAVTEGAPMPDSTTAVNGPDGCATFDPIEIPNAKGAEYIYRIIETESSEEGWKISDKPVYAKVVIGSDGSADVKYYRDKGCTSGEADLREVVNTPEIKPAEVTFTAYKTLKIKDGTSAGTIPAFTVELTPKTSGRDSDADSKNIKPSGSGNTLTGEATFKTLEFKKEGTYKYEISEVDASKSNPGYIYDKSIYEVTVEIEESGGKLTKKVYAEEKNGAKVSKDKTFSFTNYYAPATVSIGVKKSFTVKDGFTVKPEDIPEYTFNLTPQTQGRSDSQTKTIKGGNGEASFDKLVFDKEGTYVYELSEKDESNSYPGYVYDASVYTVTVKVTRSDSGYKAEVTYRKDTGEERAGSTNMIFPFSNKYAPEPVEESFKVTKQIEGEPQTQETFTFELYRVWNNREDEKVDTATLQGAGEVEFSPRSFGRPNVESTPYVYKIVEKAGSSGDCVYDTSEFEVQVVVEDDGGVLDKTVTYTKDGSLYPDGAVFTNQYMTTGSFKFYKVRYDNHRQGVKNAKYAIYRITAEDRNSDAYKTAARELASGTVDFNKLTKVTTYTSESNGKVVFDDLKAETFYVIKEEEAPRGYQISQNPIVIHTSFANGQFGVEMTSTGQNTAGKDPETGLYLWYEHRVKVIISKKKTNGELLSGATLELYDTTENQLIERWTSKSSSGHEVVVALQTGRAYKLVEKKTPQGYETAADITFTVENHPVTNSDYTQYVSMIDKQKGSGGGGSGGSGSGGSGSGSGSGTDSGASGSTQTDPSKTGDASPIGRWLIILIIAAAAVAGVLVVGRKKK